MKNDLESELRVLILEESERVSRKEWISLNGIAESLFNYRFDHVCQVVNLSKRIARIVEADLDIVTLAAWLHDIGKPGIGGASQHGKRGSERAREILMTKNVSPKVIEAVCEVIEKHVGLTLQKRIEPIEAQVIWDADKLTKLGIIGVVHFLLNGIKVDPVKTMEELENKVSEFIPLARKIASSMNTEPGRKEAAKRLGHLEGFVKQLKTELNIEEMVG